MTSSTRWRRAIAAAAITLTTTATGQASAAAEPIMSRAVIYCPAGYLCLQPAEPPQWPVVVVKEGEQRAFPGGLAVEAVANQTTLVYCVISRPSNYHLPPRQAIARKHVVLAVSPGPACRA